MLCRVMRVSKAGYFAWRDRKPSARALEDERLLSLIRSAHGESRGTYGSPRIFAELREQGERTSMKRVARLMREAGLQGIHRRKNGKQRAALAALAARTYPDQVQRQFTAPAPDRLWLADITQHPTDEGWLYLAAVLDACSLRIVGWSMAQSMSTELVVNALNMAVLTRKPRVGVIHHSDRGSQYTALAFSEKLEQHGIVGSMGGVGTAHDNAMMEAFYATLQTELLDRQRWSSRAELRTAIFEFIEIFYNRQRRHSTLGMISPAEFERRYAQQQAAA